MTNKKANVRKPLFSGYTNVLGHPNLSCCTLTGSLSAGNVLIACKVSVDLGMFLHRRGVPLNIKLSELE